MLYSSERNDTVLCIMSSCYTDNKPGADGDYINLFVEGLSLLNDPSGGQNQVVLNGVTYPLVPLTLYYSQTHSDNLVTSNTTLPDASYSEAGGATVFGNGYLLGTAPPGGIPVGVYYKQFTGVNQDYATVASPAGRAWVQSRGYTVVQDPIGWLLPTQ